MTPPGSACSIAFGRGLTGVAPGSLDNLQMVVADADATRAALSARGVEASDVDDQPWGRFVHFDDPDGNGWSLQQLPPRASGAGGTDAPGSLTTAQPVLRFDPYRRWG